MASTPSPIFKRFWRAYGGARAIVRSRYLHAALLITPFCWGSWGAPLWWDTVIGVLPNLLGFTLGGFAIFVGFGDERFKASLAAPESDPEIPTVYRELCATFVHFILIQVIALLAAIITKGMWFKADLPSHMSDLLPLMNAAWGGVCYAIFLYALTSVIAIGLHVFRIATMYETHQRLQVRSGPEQQDNS